MERGQRRGAVVGLPRRQALLREVVLDELDDVLFVVDDQDVIHHFILLRAAS